MAAVAASDSIITVQLLFQIFTLLQPLPRPPPLTTTKQNFKIAMAIWFKSYTYCVSVVTTIIFVINNLLHL